MLQDARSKGFEHIISWSQPKTEHEKNLITTGAEPAVGFSSFASFVIHQPNLMPSILSQYFRSSIYKSFCRRLQEYNFTQKKNVVTRKSTSTKRRYTFSSPRPRPSLRRTSSTGSHAVVVPASVVGTRRRSPPTVLQDTLDANVGTVHPTTTVKTEAATNYRTQPQGVDPPPTTTETPRSSSSTTRTNMIEWNAIETIAEEILYHPSSSSSSSSSRIPTQASCSLPTACPQPQSPQQQQSPTTTKKRNRPPPRHPSVFLQRLYDLLQKSDENAEHLQDGEVSLAIKKQDWLTAQRFAEGQKTLLNINVSTQNNIANVADDDDDDDDDDDETEEHRRIVPGCNDVLFGKGKKIKEHEGNIRLEKLIQSYEIEYENAGKFAKTDIAERIIRTVHEEYEGCFLKLDPTAGYWEEVERKAAREKVAHYFRHIRKKSNCSILEREYI